MPSNVIPRSHVYPSAESSCGNTVQTDSPAGDNTAPCIFVDRKSNLCKTKRALKRFTNNATGCLSVAYSLINAMSVDSVFAIMNVYMEFAIMSVCSEFAIMSVGTTLSLQIRNNSIIITANKLFCRNFCSRVRQVSDREHGNEFYNKLTGTCKPAAIIH